MKILHKVKFFLASFLVALFVILPIQPAMAGLIPGVPDLVIEVGPQNVLAWATTAANTTVIAGATVATAAELVLLNTSVGVPGVGGLVLQGAQAALDAACVGIAEAEEIAAQADNFSNFSLIGGSPAEATQIGAKIIALTTVKKCRQAELLALNRIPTPNLITGQDLIRRQDMLNSEINSLSTRLENLKARKSQTIKDILKAVALKIALNLSQRLTTVMVNKLVDKYRIQNELAYADAVATQIYTADSIKKNFQGKTADKLILRSLLQNRVVQDTILPMVRLEAEKALNYPPQQVDVFDPDFYIKMEQAGNANADPYFRQMVYEDLALTNKAAGNQHAKDEMAKGNGFMPVRNCAGSVAEQQRIDQNNQRLSYQADVDLRVYNQMLAQYTMKQTPETKEEMEKAAAALGRSTDALKSLPTEVSEPFVKMCEGISNPAGFVSNSITGYLNKHFNEAGNIKTENMPFWASFLANVTSNFVGNIIETGRPNLSILTEAGFQAGNIVANDLINQIGTNKQLQAGDKEFKFEYAKSGSGPNAYTVSWDASDIAEASYVGITDSNGLTPPTRYPVTGSIEIQAGETSVKFDLRVYNAKNEQIAIKTLDFQPVANTPGGCSKPGNAEDGTPIVWNGDIGTDLQDRKWVLDSQCRLVPYENVLGAFVKTRLPIRGPAATSLR